MIAKRRTIIAVICYACAVLVVGALLVRRAQPRRWIIEGRAATSDIDLNDVMFEENVLREEAERMGSPIVLFNHEPNRPIGRILSARFELGEIWIKAEISQTEPDVWAKIEDGTLIGLSVGVVPLEEEMDYSHVDGRPFKRLTKFMIVEVSVVSVPSNWRARIVGHAEERGR